MKTSISIDFGAHRIPGGAATILGPSLCGPDVVETTVYKALGQEIVTITLEEGDERVHRVLELLAQYEQEPWILREDIYTEDELQAAPLLIMEMTPPADCFGGPQLGTTYDETGSCPHCGSGATQTSDMIVHADALKVFKKHPVVATYYQDMLVTDKLAEQLVAANVRGLSLRKVFARMKDDSLLELPRKQLIAAHTMPPMRPNSLLTRSGECDRCHRGGMTPTFREPRRFVYRREDLQDIDDVNLTWEWIGQIRAKEGPVRKLFPYPFFLVTPKVMNILRGKKKDEGVHFVPVWIEE